MNSRYNFVLRKDKEKNDMNIIGHVYTDFQEKFGIPRQSGLVDELTGTVVFLPEGDEQQLKSSAEQLYRQIARQTLQSRVEHFAPKLGVQPASLRINGAKGRWGSCSGKNRLNFSWRLMLAPEHCIDYVVVHELCHILHHDHSAAFWQEVERVVPDWRSCRQQLVQTARAPWFWE